ncbi:hypothetical protein BGZ70_006374 [Mortierella alpina]|uniref:Uncharacterized protein n=1 Tax=Mortierella alpina TaxID=64518 RepID=A0A9P6M3W8_MORAP|nr:hypothetical protein BGZ70_006374 [Mortierella alpina]
MNEPATTNMDDYHFPLPGHQLPQPKRRAQRHQPVKIYTLGTSSHSSPHLVYSPAPMTAPPLPTHNIDASNNSKPFNNFVGRSRSVSHSVLPLRPRADSTAARMAMEAMVQAKLDQITLRLDEFNYQSHDLHARTQELAVEFQAKAKRLYQVEDHLLRVQGKPGLSEHYLESGGVGKKPRRLTNDLEELSLGVKTLRNRFQVAGTVAATTVGWLAQLREKKGHQDGSFSNAVDHRYTDPEDITVDEEAERASSGPTAIMTAWTPSSVDTASSIDPDPLADLASGGLRSPPLTPRGPLSRSSVMNKGGLSGDDRTHLSSSPSLSSHRSMNHNSKARPLSIIPDLEEPQIFTTSTVPAAAALSQEVVCGKSETRPSIPSTHFSPPSPASPVEAWTGFRGQEQEEQGHARTDSASAYASAASSEPKSVTGLENDATQRELEAHREHEEHEGDQGPLAQLEPDHQQEQPSADKSTSLSDKDDDEEETWSEIDQTLEQPMPNATCTVESAQDELVASSSSEVPTHAVDSNLADINASEHDDAGTPGITKDTWIQFFWRLLVRAEYFFLGTAVLGAMMPENLVALCAGFLSAIVYGILLIRHRIAAAPGTEAPRPPTGNRDKTLRKRLVKDRVRSRSYRAGSSSGFRESSNC